MTNKEVIQAYTKTKESLNPILDELQEMNGFVSRNDIIEIANAFFTNFIRSFLVVLSTEYSICFIPSYIYSYKLRILYQIA